MSEIKSPLQKSASMRYRLRKDVFPCLVGGIYVFLDATNDRYLRLNSEQTKWYLRVTELACSSVRRDKILSEFADRLVKHGILIEALNKSEVDEYETFDRPRASLLTTLSPQRHPVRAEHIVTFVRALLSTWLLEKTNDFYGVYLTVRGWKSHRPSSGPDIQVRAFELAQIFHQLTPFFFTSDNECRYRSLALLRFLALSHVPANWQFGVRVGPFCAHCWVECGGVVLNEYFDTVDEYQIIMSI